MARTEECILYRNFDNGEVLDIMTSLMNNYEAGEEGFENRKEEFFHMAGSLVEMAGMYGFFRESVAHLSDAASGQSRECIQYRFRDQRGSGGKY